MKSFAVIVMIVIAVRASAGDDIKPPVSTSSVNLAAFQHSHVLVKTHGQFNDVTLNAYTMKSMHRWLCALQCGRIFGFVCVAFNAYCKNSC